MVHEIVQWVLAAEKDIYVYPISKEINLHDNNMDMPWSQGSDGMSAPIEIKYGIEEEGLPSGHMHVWRLAASRPTNPMPKHREIVIFCIACMHWLVARLAQHIARMQMYPSQSCLHWLPGSCRAKSIPPPIVHSTVSVRYLCLVTPVPEPKRNFYCWMHHTWMMDGWSPPASRWTVSCDLRECRGMWRHNPSRPLCVLYASKIDAADRAGRIALLQHTIYYTMELFCRIQLKIRRNSPFMTVSNSVVD